MKSIALIAHPSSGDISQHRRARIEPTGRRASRRRQWQPSKAEEPEDATYFYSLSSFFVIQFLPQAIQDAC